VSGPDGKPQIALISSIERYRRTQLFENQGLPAVEIRRLGGGPSQFTIAAGNPQASVTQADMGLFLQDDWRMRPNLTLSLGMRYETQTNIHDWRDLGPRIGFGWAPGTRGNRPGKTVIRGGFGTFYDRFSESLVLQAERFNGINQQQIIVQNPDFYPVVPPVETLNGKRITQSIREIGKDLRAPYILQTAIGIERQLPRNTTFAVTYTNSRAVHLLRSRDINAPLPGTFSAAGSGVRPYGEVGEIFEYESNGILNQNMMIANLNSRLSRNFSLFTNYRLNFAKSDTDGAGTSPANPYDLRTEYGRAAIDSRHWFALGGSFLFKGGFRLSPFVIARSGGPFNITTGRDANGDSVFNDRPAFATDLTKSNIIQTRYGNFDPNPSSGEVIIPRNDANGPGLFTVNLRLGRTFGFGPTRAAAANSGEPSGGRGGGGARGGRGGGGGGGMRMGGGGGGGFRGGGGEGTTSRRYNLTLSISARNLLNHTNPGPPIGNLTSPLFGLSNSLAGGFGPAASAGNRRIDLQLRFTF